MQLSIKSAIIALLFLNLQACQFGTESSDAQVSGATTFKGHYIIGHEVNSFQPCGQDNVFWVTGSDEVLYMLESNYLEFDLQPYQEVFLELQGEFIGQAKNGFAADYDGQIQVFRLVDMQEKTDNDCR